jgi:CDP-glucose 4,6-dehydratase
MNNLFLLKNFFKKKKILITGHTGFKGAWLCQILLLFEADIMGVSYKRVSKINLFDILQLKNKIKKHIIFDLSVNKKFNEEILKFNPDYIFHLASQSLVIEGYKRPYHTFFNNINSSLNLLENSKKIKNLKAIIFVTSDKCYDPKKTKKLLVENDAMGGNDPYSISKACSEHIFKYYQKSYFKLKNIGAASVRSGNVIGGGDWSQNRLIPDFIRSVKKKKFILRNPSSVRPWQHVLDCLFGYLILLIKISRKPALFSESWNFGPTDKNITTEKLILELSKKLSSKVKIIRFNKEQYQETAILKLNINKMKNKLKYKPTLYIDEAIDFTASWYKNYLQKKNNIDFTNNQIKKYIKKIKYKI